MTYGSLTFRLLRKKKGSSTGQLGVYSGMMKSRHTRRPPSFTRQGQRDSRPDDLQVVTAEDTVALWEQLVPANGAT